MNKVVLQPSGFEKSVAEITDSWPWKFRFCPRERGMRVTYERDNRWMAILIRERRSSINFARQYL